MIGFLEQTIWYHVRRLHWPKPKRDRLVKWNKTACISFMEDPLWEYIILSRSVTKHSHHRQFVFQVGKFLSKISSETILKNKAKFDRRHLWKVLYKISSCHLKWKKTSSPLTILVSDWVQLNTFLKLEGTNGAWEILCNISIFEPAIQLIWPPKAVLVCELPITNTNLL